eukprot:JP436720.1.p2 GENE.JP436720.1~~JP436720.1.p2  ORF type:complete len:55 (-),score=0.40 JP436720.1:29-193(-)
MSVCVCIIFSASKEASAEGCALKITLQRHECVYMYHLFSKQGGECRGVCTQYNT